MSFGLEVFGSDGSGTFLVTDTSANLIHQGVAAAGTGSSVSLSGTTVKPQIYVNAKNVSGQNEGIFAVWDSSSKVVYFYALTVTFQSSTQVTFTWTAKSVNYFIVRSTGDNPLQSQDYGLQIFTDSGTVAIDSRAFGTNESHFISEVSAGNLNHNSYGDQITSDQDAYIEMGWSGASQGTTNSVAAFRCAKFNSTNIVANSRILISITIFGQAGFVSNPWGLPTMLIGKLR